MEPTIEEQIKTLRELCRERAQLKTRLAELELMVYDLGIRIRDRVSNIEGEEGT